METYKAIMNGANAMYFYYGIIVTLLVETVVLWVMKKVLEWKTKVDKDTLEEASFCPTCGKRIKKEGE